MFKSTAAARQFYAAASHPTRRLLAGRASKSPITAMAAMHQPTLLLVGSSIIEQWVEAPRQLQPFPVVNLGVSGSTTRDWLPRGAPHHGSGLLQRLLLPRLTPGADNLIVFYAGSNDINQRVPATTIFAQTQELAQMIWTLQPQCKLLYISVMAAPQKARDGLLPAVVEVNDLVQQWARSQHQLQYVDINTDAVGDAAAAGASMYVEDELHLTPAAYAVMSRCVLSALQS